MFIISFSQLFLYDHSQGVIIIFLLSTSCSPPLAPRWRFMGKTAIFHNKAIGINWMYHTFGYIFVNSLFLII